MQITTILKFFGSILIIISTFLITVTIPSIENNIKNEQEKIEKFKNISLLSGIAISHANTVRINTHLYLFESNISENKEKQNNLRQKALDAYIEEIVLWNSFFKNEKSNNDQELQSLKKNIDLTIKQKIEKLDMIRDDRINNANNKLINSKKKHNNAKQEQEILEKSHQKWNKWFIWLQISGLICIALPEKNPFKRKQS